MLGLRTVSAVSPVVSVDCIHYIAHEAAICHTYQYTVLQEAEKTWLILNKSTLKHVMFLQIQGEAEIVSGFTAKEILSKIYKQWQIEFYKSLMRGVFLFLLINISSRMR